MFDYVGVVRVTTNHRDVNECVGYPSVLTNDSLVSDAELHLEVTLLRGR